MIIMRTIFSTSQEWLDVATFGGKADTLQGQAFGLLWKPYTAQHHTLHDVCFFLSVYFTFSA